LRGSAGEYRGYGEHRDDPHAAGRGLPGGRGALRRRPGGLGRL